LSIIGIQKETLFIILPFGFYFLFIFLLLLVAKSLSIDYEGIIYIFLLGLILTINRAELIKPALLCFLFALILVYTLFKISFSKNPKKEYFVIFFIVTITAILSHPLTSLYSTGLIVVIIGGLIIFNYTKTKLIGTQHLHLITLSILLFISNLLYYSSLLWNVQQFLEIITNEYTPTFQAINSQVTYAQSAQTDYFFIAQRVIETYGNHIILLAITIICLIYVMYNFKNKNLKIQLRLFVFIILFNLFFAAFLSLGLIVWEPIRILGYSLFLSQIFIGLSLSFYSMQQSKKNRVVKNIVVTLIIMAVILSLFNFYQSPWKGGINEQISFKEYHGIAFFLTKSNENIPVSTHALMLSRWPTLYFEKNIKSKYNNNFSIPSHFNYLNDISLGHTYDKEKRYILTNEVMKVMHLAARDEIRNTTTQYLENDFQRLNIDNTVKKIYVTEKKDRGFEIWIVN